jgi:hypothetical protein
VIVSRWSFETDRGVNGVANDLRPTTTGSPKDYNNCVDAPVPLKPVPENKHLHRHSIYAAEATGLLIMAILLLILTVVRYWRDIPWSAR